MYQSTIQIKHTNRSHLYWGIEKATGEIVDIDDVSSRGLNCNCKCAACCGDFIAKRAKRTSTTLRITWAFSATVLAIKINKVAPMATE